MKRKWELEWNTAFLRDTQHMRRLGKRLEQFRTFVTVVDLGARAAFFQVWLFWIYDQGRGGSFLSIGFWELFFVTVLCRGWCYFLMAVAQMAKLGHFWRPAPQGYLLRTAPQLMLAILLLFPLHGFRLGDIRSFVHCCLMSLWIAGSFGHYIRIHWAELFQELTGELPLPRQKSRLQLLSEGDRFFLPFGTVTRWAGALAAHGLVIFYLVDRARPFSWVRFHLGLWGLAFPLVYWGAWLVLWLQVGLNIGPNLGPGSPEYWKRKLRGRIYSLSAAGAAVCLMDLFFYRGDPGVLGAAALCLALNGGFSRYALSYWKTLARKGGTPRGA